jgi:hypothetical protein
MAVVHCGMIVDGENIEEKTINSSKFLTLKNKNL